MYPRARKVIIGSVIGVILLLQAIASFGTLAGLHANRKFWPWTNYPMYEQKYSEGDYIDVTGIIYLVLDSGDRIQFTEADLEIGFWRFFYLYNRLSDLEEPRREDIEMILDVVTTEAEVVAIETYHYPMQIGKEGPQDAELKLRRRLELER